MKHVHVTLALVLAATLWTASPTFADGIFTPFAGVSFGSDQTEKVTTYGLSLAGMAGGIFGVEVDWGRTTLAKTSTLFAANSRATTLTGNIIVGIPLGPIRPYAVGGIGWMRTELTDKAEIGKGITSDGLGVDFGGGLMGFFSDHVGVRVDLRYIRAITAGENFLDFDFENFNYWRFTGGVALKF